MWQLQQVRDQGHETTTQDWSHLSLRSRSKEEDVHRSTRYKFNRDQVNKFIYPKCRHLKVSKYMLEAFLNQEPAITVLSQGVKPKVVKMALFWKLQASGTNFTTTKELMKIISILFVKSDSEI